MKTRHLLKTLQYQCPTCIVCGERAIVEVPTAGAQRWQAGEFIQVALPELTVDERELLITGTHPACWDTLWPEEEE